MIDKNSPRLIVISGATATGKTDVAFALAKKLECEILSFDSVQIYKHLDIGTAKPPLWMRNEIPHHLIDEIEPSEPFTAGDFQRRARKIISLENKKKNIVLVGGTGFYLQALLRGMYEIPVVTRVVKEKLLVEQQTRGLDVLYAELKTKDSEYAKRIHPNDSYRILRALELIRSGTKTVTEIRAEFSTHHFPYPVLHIGLRRKRDSLLDSVAKRTEKMIESGLIEETKSLIKNLGRDLKPLESVGYRETVAFLDGVLDRNSLKDQIVRSTMALAKRQSTWFKKDESIIWLDPDVEGARITEQILDIAYH